MVYDLGVYGYDISLSFGVFGFDISSFFGVFGYGLEYMDTVRYMLGVLFTILQFTLLRFAPLEAIPVLSRWTSIVE